ncbi:hypothetical protein ACWEPL_11990 [Nonomuraea sp. NPDC004186]
MSSSRLLPELVAGTFALSVVTLASLTATGALGDHLYGAILMGVLTFPFSAVGVAVGLAAEKLDPNVITLVAWEWTSLLWPGLVEALVMWLLLRFGARSSRIRLWGNVVALVTASLVLFAGLVTLFDQWAPRRPGGIPLIILGIAQGFLWFLGHRARARTGRIRE